LIQRDRPVLIVEASSSGDIADWLRQRDYDIRQTPGSSNIVAMPTA
jgi:hypothetical protein